MDPEVLRRHAAEVRKNSYSPYSGFKVGAALKVKGVEEVFVGTNVENSSFGGTICAERSAVLAAVATLGRFTPEAIAVVAECNPPVVPCAICLGFLAEFSPPDLPIYACTSDKVEKIFRLGDLLPNPFKLLRE